MKGKIRIDKRKSEERKNGHPVYVFLNHKGKQKKINLGLYFQLSEWDFEKELPKNDAAATFYLKKKKLLLEEIIYNNAFKLNIDFEAVKSELLGLDQKELVISSFYDFAEVYVNELLEKNKKSSAASYENAINQLKGYRSNLYFNEVDYNLLNGFKNWRLKDSNSKSTVHTYLRKFRCEDGLTKSKA